MEKYKPVFLQVNDNKRVKARLLESGSMSTKLILRAPRVLMLFWIGAVVEVFVPGFLFYLVPLYVLALMWSTYIVHTEAFGGGEQKQKTKKKVKLEVNTRAVLYVLKSEAIFFLVFNAGWFTVFGTELTLGIGLIDAIFVFFGIIWYMGIKDNPKMEGEMKNECN